MSTTPIANEPRFLKGMVVRASNADQTWLGFIEAIRADGLLISSKYEKWQHFFPFLYWKIEIISRH